MLLFIKSVNLTLNEETGAIVISGIEHNIYDDVNQLIKGFYKVEEDFEKMEDQFDKKFNALILLYFQQFKQEEVEKERCKIDKSVASHTVSNHPFLSVILPKIFFKDLLMFYDEYSYAISERISNLYELFLNVVSESRNIPNFNEIIQSKLEHNEDFKKFEYLDLHYFRNKLETKISTVFPNTVSEIRNILYGHHFEDEAAKMEYIHLFYRSVLYYKEDYSTPSGIKLFSCLGKIPKSLIGYRKNIHDTIRKHIKYISYNLPLLYNYRQEVAKIFDVSHTRFQIYEKMLDVYRSIKNSPFSIGFEEKESFDEHEFQQYLRTPKHNFLYEELKISALQDHVFKYLIYTPKVRFYNMMLDEIKNILVSIYTRI